MLNKACPLNGGKEGINVNCASGTEHSKINPVPVYATASAAAWPMYQHDAQHTGQSPYVGPSTSDIKWTMIGSFAAGTAVGSDGTIYAASGGAYGGNNALAITPDGTIKHSFPGVNLCCASPAIGPGGTVYFSGGGYSPFSIGGTTALNPDFTLGWNNPMGICCGSMTIGPDATVYIGDGSVVAVNPANGSTNWTFNPSNGYLIGQGPAISHDGGTLYATTATFLYALSPLTGNVIWSYSINKFKDSGPVVGADGTVYVSSGQSIKAVNPDGTLKQDIPLPKYAYTLAVASDGTIICIAVDASDAYTNGTLYALNSDGTQKWSAAVWTGASVGGAQPIMDANGKIYIADATNDGTLYHCYIVCFDAQGNNLWTYNFPPSPTLMGSPLLSIDAQGTLYHEGGALYAFAPKSLAIDITLNQTGFTTGQTITATAHITNDSTPDKVDLKVAVDLPDGSRVSLGKIDGYNIPANADITLPPVIYTFNGSEPAGIYKVYGRLLEMKLGDHLSTDMEPFSFNP